MQTLSTYRVAAYAILVASVVLIEMASPGAARSVVGAIPGIGAAQTGRPGSLTYPATVGKLLGPANRLQTVTLGLILRGDRDRDIRPLMLQQTNPTSPLYHRWLTPAEFGRYFGIPIAESSRLSATLRSHGIHVDYLAGGGRFILAHAEIGALESTFKTSIEVRTNGRIVYMANRFVPTIPPDLPLVHSVVGLDNFYRVHSHLVAGSRDGQPRGAAQIGSGGPRPNPDATVLSGQFAFGPADIDAAYDFTPLQSSGDTGTGVAIALQETRQPLQSNFNNFNQQFMLPSLSIHEIYMQGTCAPPCPAPANGFDTEESDADTQWFHAVAPGASIDTIAVGDDEPLSQLLGFEYIANVLGNTVQVVSSSYGACEFANGPDLHDGFAAAIDQGILEGQTWFKASGDFGADDCETGLIASVDSPSDSPEIVSVGGTSMNPPKVLGNVTGYGPEIVWNNTGCSNVPTNEQGASGGGRSFLFAIPPWQVGKTYANEKSRDIPDVSLLADEWISTSPGVCPQKAGYWTYVFDPNVNMALWEHLGGTSIGSPIWAGLFADIAQKVGGPVGLISPTLYKNEGSSAFHQITVGNNSFDNVTGFSAASPYNAATGLGTPDAAQIAALFSGVAPNPQPTTFPPPGPHPSSSPAVIPTARAFVPNLGHGSPDDGDVEIYEATVGTSLGSLFQSFGGLTAPVDVAFSSGGSTVYVLESTGVIDTINTGVIPYTLKLDKYHTTSALVSSLAIKSNMAYVADYLDQDIQVVPLSGGTAPPPIPVGWQPVNVTANPQQSFLYIANAGSDTVSIINSTTNLVVQTLAVGHDPSHLAVTKNGKTLLVSNSGDGTVSVVNVATMPATVKSTVFVGGEPTGIATNASNSIAYVANFFCPSQPAACNTTGNPVTSNGSVELVLLNKTPIKVQCCIVVGQLPVAASFEPTYRYLFVANSGSFSITVIDTFDNSIYGTFTVAPNPGQDWDTMGSFVHVVP